MFLDRKGKNEHNPLKRERSPMVSFIAGMFVGSLVMLVIMSMMFVAKQADEQSANWQKK
jgi:flagellar basal body-associated protein FliL